MLPYLHSKSSHSFKKSTKWVKYKEAIGFKAPEGMDMSGNLAYNSFLSSNRSPPFPAILHFFIYMIFLSQWTKLYDHWSNQIDLNHVWMQVNMDKEEGSNWKLNPAIIMK